MDKKTIIYNKNKVILVKNVEEGYNPLSNDEYLLVETIAKAKIMLSAMGVDISLLNN